MEVLLDDLVVGVALDRAHEHFLRRAIVPERQPATQRVVVPRPAARVLRRRRPEEAAVRQIIAVPIPM